MISVHLLLDIEDVFGFLVWCINLLYLRLPSVQVVILSGLQSLLEVVTDLLEFLALVQVLPVGTQDVLHSFHVDAKTALDLFCPCDFVWDLWESLASVQHGLIMAHILVLVVEELVSQNLDVFLDFHQQLDLILLDSTSDSWTSKKCIENLENSEHLVGTLGLWQLRLKDTSDLWFNLIDFEIVCSFSLLPLLWALSTDVKDIYSIEWLIGLVNLAEGNIFHVGLVFGHFLRKRLLDDLAELLVMLSEDEDTLKPLFEWILHDALHCSAWSNIESGPVVRDVCSKLSNFVVQKGEDLLNFSSLYLKFRVVDQHDLEVGENLQKLCVEILDNALHEKDCSWIGVLVSACLSDVSELNEYQIYGSSCTFQIICWEELVDWEVSQEFVVVLGCCQLLLEFGIKSEVVDELDLLGSLEKLQCCVDHLVLKLLLNIGEVSFDGQPELDLLECWARLWIVVELSDAPDISNPLRDSLLKLLDEWWVWDSILKVIRCEFSSELFDFFVFLLDLRVMNKVNLWNHDVLLVLNQMYLELREILCDVIKPRRGSSSWIGLTLARGLVWIEKW